MYLGPVAVLSGCWYGLRSNDVNRHWYVIAWCIIGLCCVVLGEIHWNMMDGFKPTRIGTWINLLSPVAVSGGILYLGYNSSENNNWSMVIAFIAIVPTVAVTTIALNALGLTRGL